MVAHGRKVMDAHRRMVVAFIGLGASPNYKKKSMNVSPHPELKDVADSEQQGRFDSVQFTSFSLREGFTN